MEWLNHGASHKDVTVKKKAFHIYHGKKTITVIAQLKKAAGLTL